jgi:hypothetical protein
VVKKDWKCKLDRRLLTLKQRWDYFTSWRRIINHEWTLIRRLLAAVAPTFVKQHQSNVDTNLNVETTSCARWDGHESGDQCKQLLGSLSNPLIYVWMDSTVVLHWICGNGEYDSSASMQRSIGDMFPPLKTWLYI